LRVDQRKRSTPGCMMNNVHRRCLGAFGRGQCAAGFNPQARRINVVERFARSMSGLSGQHVDPRILELSGEWERWRKHIHANPELGCEEIATSSFVAHKLESWGLQLHTGLAKTGVVGTLAGTKATGSTPAMTLGFRADMDCLPMEEENAFEHKSQLPMRFHGCGHDGHTTILLGAAQYLSERKDRFRGKVRFIFQPAEENLGGAKLMMDDGLFEGDLECDEIYAVHNWPYMGRGKIIAMNGAMMAGNDDFDISIRGTGGHAAMPHLTHDPIVVASQVVTSLQSLVSRTTDPHKPTVLTVTNFNSGDGAYNVIPDRATLSGTLRCFCMEDRERLLKAIVSMVENTCAAHGVLDYSIDFKNDGYPPTINTAEQVAVAKQAAEKVVGKGNVLENQTPSSGAEDFAFMLQKVPGAYIWISGKSPIASGYLHEPYYDYDDLITPIGVQYFANLVEARLG